MTHPTDPEQTCACASGDGWRWPEQYHHHGPHCQPHHSFQTLFCLNAISKFLKVAAWTRHRAVEHGRTRIWKCICHCTERASRTGGLDLDFNGIHVGRTIAKNGAAYDLTLFQCWNPWPKALHVSFWRRASCPVISEFSPALGPWWKHVVAMSCKDVKRVGLNGDLRREGAAEQLTTFWKESVTGSAEFSHQTKQLYYLYIFIPKPSPESWKAKCKLWHQVQHREETKIWTNNKKLSNYISYFTSCDPHHDICT